MKFLVWCGCVTICLDGLELSLYTHDWWRWLWIALLVFYVFAGVVTGLVSLAKLVAGKSGAGALGGLRGLSSRAPAPKKEE